MPRSMITSSDRAEQARVLIKSQVRFVIFSSFNVSKTGKFYAQSASRLSDSVIRRLFFEGLRLRLRSSNASALF